MSKLIDYLDSIDVLTQEKLFDYICQNDIKTLDSLVVYMRQLIDEDYLLNEYSPFVFVPNGDISGTGGCDEISCRVGRAERFAVFSALYADRVYIQLQFITQEHYEFYDIDEIENDSMMLRNYKMHILKDMAIILVYSELIRNKIVFITPTHQMVCPNCFRKRVLGENSVDIEKIKGEYFSRAKVILDNYDSLNEEVNIRVKNIDEFFPDHDMFWAIRDDEIVHLLENEKIGKEIKNQEYANKFIEEFIDEEILSALYTTQYCNEQDAKLITNKISDTMFLALNKNMQEVGKMKEYINMLPEYELLITQNLSLKDVLKLRQEEAESFNKYRIALNKAVIEQNRTSDIRDWHKIYDDIIYPEINNLDMKMKQIKEGRLSRFFGTMIVLGTTVVANKFGDILPSNLGAGIQSIGTSVSAAGINYLFDKTSANKQEMQNNDYFFLWKLRNSTKGNDMKDKHIFENTI